MTWTARITHAPGGELRLLFPEAVHHIDMDRETARHFASLIAMASEGRSLECAETSPKPKPPTKALRGAIRAGYKANCRRLAAVSGSAMPDIDLDAVELAVEWAMTACSSLDGTPIDSLREATRKALIGAPWFPTFSFADWLALTRNAARVAQLKEGLK